MSRSEELVPLADRLGALLLVRLAVAAIVLVSARVAPGEVRARPGALATLTAVYALVSVAAELARRVGAGRRLGLATAALVVDGLYIWLVLARTGGPESVLGFIVYLHVVAVTLLVSYRTGLKIALWHGLLLFAVYYLRQASLWPAWTGVPSGHASHVSAFAGVAFWLVAIGTAAFSSLNERELRRGKAELRLLADLGARLQHATTPEAVGAVVADHTTALGFRRVALYAGDESGDVLVAASWSTDAPVLSRVVDARESPDVAALLPGACNVVVAPCVADDVPVGALIAERGGGGDARIARHIVDLVAQIATQAALALRAATLRADVERLARTDALTGLANRRTFDEMLARELDRSARTGDPCTLVLVDVDHFKAVNDTHGHQAGDGVLQRVAQALTDGARGMDLAARYGGEEFAVIAPGCGHGEALALAERFRAAIAAQPGDVAVTVSAGVAVYPPDGVDANTLVAAADEALYTSKRAGRDRATLAVWPEPAVDAVITKT